MNLYMYLIFIFLIFVIRCTQEHFTRTKGDYIAVGGNQVVPAGQPFVIAYG